MRIAGKKGSNVWQAESYDRVVWDSVELANELAYINYNPIKAGLVELASSQLPSSELADQAYPYLYNAVELREAGWKPALRGKINYTVWSDVFVCSECSQEVVFWEAAVDKEAGKVHDAFPCPHCHATLTKRNMERAWVNKFDSALNDSIRQAKQFLF